MMEYWRAAPLSAGPCKRRHLGTSVRGVGGGQTINTHTGGATCDTKHDGMMFCMLHREAEAPAPISFTP